VLFPRSENLLRMSSSSDHIAVILARGYLRSLINDRSRSRLHVTARGKPHSSGVNLKIEVKSRAKHMEK